MTLWGYARTEPTVLVAWPSIVLFSHALRWLAGRHARWHLRDKQCYGLPVAVRFWFGLGLAFSCYSYDAVLVAHGISNSFAFAAANSPSVRRPCDFISARPRN